MRDALCARLAAYDRLVEVGIGHRTGLAGALATSGVAVTATDRVPRETPSGVGFVRDDITTPEPAVYADADALYALRLPPELHRPVLLVARRSDADLLFTTLGGDAPTIPVVPETLPGITLYRACVSDSSRTRRGPEHRTRRLSTEQERYATGAVGGRRNR